MQVLADTYLVSVIMPTYNRAAYIVDTIESVRQQTYTNWELIIVDDGSDDNTEELVEAIGDSRIRFYKAGRIGISSKIKNIGLKNAVGDMIAFIDSDDLWAATKLEKQLQAFAEYPGAGFSLTGGYNFKELNNPLEYFYKQKEGVKYGDAFAGFFKSEVAATVPTLMVKRASIEAVGGFDETKPVADMEFILRLAQNFNAIILYEPLFFRRLHEGNYSSMNWIKRHNQGLELIRSYSNMLTPDLLADSLFRSHINFGETCLQHREGGRAIQQFLQAWKHKPMSIVSFKKTAKAVLSFFK